MRIVIAPWAAKLPNNIRNAKNYNAWPELVKLLREEGHEVVQIAGQGEERVEGVGQFIEGCSLDTLEEVLRGCDTWISVDSFLPHFCATMRLKPGIVIWAQSDPKIWGYKHNINLSKGAQYLRERQYAPWYEAEYNEDAFVEPEVVMEALHGKFATAVAQSG